MIKNINYRCEHVSFFIEVFISSRLFNRGSLQQKQKLSHFIKFKLEKN